MPDQQPSSRFVAFLVNAAPVVGGFATFGLLVVAIATLPSENENNGAELPPASGEWAPPITVTSGARAALCADRPPVSVEVGIEGGQVAKYVYLDGREEKLHEGGSHPLYDDCKIRLERTGRDETPKALPYAVLSVGAAER